MSKTEEQVRYAAAVALHVKVLAHRFMAAPADDQVDLVCLFLDLFCSPGAPNPPSYATEANGQTFLDLVAAGYKKRWRRLKPIETLPGALDVDEAIAQALKTPHLAEVMELMRTDRLAADLAAARYLHLREHVFELGQPRVITTADGKRFCDRIEGICREIQQQRQQEEKARGSPLARNPFGPARRRPGWRPLI